MSEHYQPAPEEVRSEVNMTYEQLSKFVQQKRAEAGVLNEEGQLDMEKKFAKSAYDILSLDYYKKNVCEIEKIAYTLRDENDEEFREGLIANTQLLIKEFERASDKGEEPDVLFFLDKSARPVAWMLMELWPLFASSGHKMPEIKFINFDVNRFFNMSDSGPRPEIEQLYDWEPTEQQIKELRSVYERDGVKLPKHPGEASRAWVIDEVAVSGGSRIISKRLLEEAFPNLTVQSKVWMPTTLQTSGPRAWQSKQPNKLAPWYNHQMTEGRGVGEPAINRFLSSRKDNDLLSEALRSDIQLLAKDIKEGRQSVRGIVGAYETDPETGEVDTERPKYRIGGYIKGSHGRQDKHEIIAEP